MISETEIPGEAHVDHPLRDRFLKWQCRVRQMAMRDNQGRPDDAIAPQVFLPGDSAPTGQIITVLNKNPAHSMTPELHHMARKTNDPALIRAQAIQFLSATYYQKHRSFSDLLTAVFAPGSHLAARICAAQACTLAFEAYAQRFSLTCRVGQVPRSDPLKVATMAHNRLFNPSLSPDSVVLGFEPDWHRCSDASASDQPRAKG